MISLPLNDSIYVTDFSDQVKAIPFRSNLVRKAYELDVQNKAIDPSNISSYYAWLSGAYLTLLYDEKTGHIYRVARSGVSHDDFLEGNLYATTEVVVMNDKFEIMGKIPHSGTTFMYNYFHEKESLGMPVLKNTIYLQTMKTQFILKNTRHE